MHVFRTDKFDALLEYAAYACVQDEANAFLKTDTAAASVSARFERRLLRRIRGNAGHTGKIVVAVILAAALLALSACACIPEVREYFWRIVTTDMGDYFDVKFEETPLPETTDTEVAEQTTEEKIETPPYSALAQKAYIDDLPAGYCIADEMEISTSYMVNYNYADGEWAFTMVQTLATASNTFIDSDGELESVWIHNNQAVLCTEEVDGVVCYQLLWRDGEYTYNLYGIFSGKEELIMIAESMKLRDKEES